MFRTSTLGRNTLRRVRLQRRLHSFLLRCSGSRPCVRLSAQIVKLALVDNHFTSVLLNHSPPKLESRFAASAKASLETLSPLHLAWRRSKSHRHMVHQSWMRRGKRSTRARRTDGGGAQARTTSWSLTTQTDGIRSRFASDISLHSHSITARTE